jgi:glutamate racemase
MNYLNNFSDFTGKYSPVGVFDSGYGGLTILNYIKNQFPDYDFIYLGDNSRAPYGNLSDSNIINYSKQSIDYLFSLGCCKVIIACNTASSKKELNIKNTINIIKPTIDFISNFDNVAVLSTTSTFESGVYNSSSLIVKDCPMWVSLIESGYHNTFAGKEIIKKDLKDLFRDNPEIETILLGCTHFNLLKNYIGEIYPNVKILTQDKILSEYLKISDINCSKNGTIKYLTTEDPGEFDEEAKEFLGLTINSERIYL